MRDLPFSSGLRLDRAAESPPMSSSELAISKLPFSLFDQSKVADIYQVLIQKVNRNRPIQTPTKQSDRRTIDALFFGESLQRRPV